VQLLNFFRQEASSRLGPVLWLTLLTGVADIMVMTSINEALGHLSDGDTMARYMIMAAIASVLFALSQKWLMHKVAPRLEQAVHTLRLRFAERVCLAEVHQIGEVGRERLTACLSREIPLIAQAIPNIVLGLHAVATIGLTLLYIAAYSHWAAGLTLVTVGITSFFCIQHSAPMQQAIGQVHEAELAVAERSGDLLDGFREAKMEPARALAIVDAIRRHSAQVLEQRSKLDEFYAQDYILMELTLILAMGAVVFLLPLLRPVPVEATVAIANAVSFMISPVLLLIASLPILTNAEVALAKIRKTQKHLTTAEDSRIDNPPPLSGFRRIGLQDVMFTYRREDGGPGFSVGPLDLTVQRGQIVFISGNNGSGKSTLVQLLLGLLPPDEGSVLLGGHPVGPELRVAYRKLFAAVFADGHLTREFYGLPSIDGELARDLFTLLEMEDKATIVNGAFSTINLSSGQRKRLALIAALLEKKPILVLDEWAADQSPHFREKFYRQVLPWLKTRGLTIIAVTHDERYFDAADMHVHVKDGQIARIDVAPVQTVT